MEQLAEQPEQQVKKKIDLTQSQILLREILEVGYNKSKIARETGISRRTVNNLFCGNTQKPHNGTFMRLLKLYCSLKGTDIQEEPRAC